MKALIFVLILSQLGLFTLATSDKNSNQVVIEPYTNQLYTFQAADVYQVFDPEEVVSNTDICNDIMEELVYFGHEALDLYKTCDQDYIMLGSKHPLIQGQRPGCFLSLVRSFCNYQIQLHEDAPHSNELREFITVTLMGCVQGKTPDQKNYFECPSLNLETGIVEDEAKFCKSMENAKDYLKIPNGNENVEEDLSYRLYTFIGKNTVQACMAITRLYNFCVNVSDHTGSDPKLCFSRDFRLYEDGAYIKLYNKRMMEKCSNAILPFMAYSQMTEDLLNPVETYGFCDDINNRIQNGYNFRANQVNNELIAAQQHLGDVEHYLALLGEIGGHIPSVIKQIYSIVENWSFVYHNMTSARTSVITNISVTIFIRQNLELMNDSLADWVMQGRNSLSYLKSTIPEEASLLNYYDPLIADFEKIELLGEHLIDFTSYIDQLYHQQIDLNSKVNGVDEDEDNIIQFENLDNIDRLLMTSRQTYQNFLTQLNQRKLNELTKLNKDLEEAQQRVARWEEVAKQLAYQMEMVYDYLQ